MRAPPAATWDDALAAADAELQPAAGTADSVCLFIYTSGTTGPSKGVVVTQQYLTSAARRLATAHGYTSEDRLYSATPLFHVSGSISVVLQSLVSGVTAVLDSAFSPTATWDRVRKYQATVFIGVGPMMMMLLGLPEDPSDAELPLRIIAAVPIPADLCPVIERRYSCRLAAIYGMTEAFPMILTDPAEETVPGSSGTSNPDFEILLMDPDGNEVPVGEVGEVVCRPRRPHVMFREYFGRPEATVEQTADLWFHTGDAGRFDQDGNFFFVDRKKDAIRRRGENISSFEVEMAVARHPAVAEVAAHPVPSPLGEDDVKICVVLAPDGTVTAEELYEHCVAHMPRFALPRYIEFVEALPKNAVGRVQKFKLRESSVTERTWDKQSGNDR